MGKGVSYLLDADIIIFWDLLIVAVSNWWCFGGIGYRCNAEKAMRIIMGLVCCFNIYPYRMLTLGW